MFRHQTSQTSAPKKRISNKFFAVVAALAVTSLITASSFAAAAPQGKPTKAECQAAGFTNYGQCVKEWAHNKNHPGHGYGYGGGHHHGDDEDDNDHGHHGGQGASNASIATKIHLALNNSNNNIITIIVNIFR